MLSASKSLHWNGRHNRRVGTSNLIFSEYPIQKMTSLDCWSNEISNHKTWVFVSFQCKKVLLISLRPVTNLHWKSCWTTHMASSVQQWEPPTTRKPTSNSPTEVGEKKFHSWHTKLMITEMINRVNEPWICDWSCRTNERIGCPAMLDCFLRMVSIYRYDVCVNRAQDCRPASLTIRLNQ